jgi:hypothetical protein
MEGGALSPPRARLTDILLRQTEQSPPGDFLFSARVAFEVDFKPATGRIVYFVPVFANIKIAASVTAGSGIAPFTHNANDHDYFVVPFELPGQTRLPGRHAIGVECSGHGFQRFADEFFFHDAHLLRLTCMLSRRFASEGPTFNSLYFRRAAACGMPQFGLGSNQSGVVRYA